MPETPKWYENPLLLSLLSSRLAPALIGVLLSALMGLAGLPLGITQEALDLYRSLVGIEPQECPPCPPADPVAP
jgi:hypothetical protein